MVKSDMGDKYIDTFPHQLIKTIIGSVYKKVTLEIFVPNEPP